jgi:hypothetical protein
LIALRNRVAELEGKQAGPAAVDLSPRVENLEKRANDNDAAWNTLAEAVRPKG